MVNLIHDDLSYRKFYDIDQLFLVDVTDLVVRRKGINVVIDEVKEPLWGRRRVEVDLDHSGW